MADNTKNITSQDVTAWLRTAPTDQIMPVVTQGLDKIADDPSYHDRFVNQLSPRARKLFQGEPVG